MHRKNFEFYHKAFEFAGRMGTMKVFQAVDETEKRIDTLLR